MASAKGEPTTKKPRCDEEADALLNSCPRVLSVQSHVVHGYVGNRAAVFPLQLLGFEVDVINSVQFSCHTGYPSIKGQRLSGDELHTLVDGLMINQVLNHSYLLTGYIGAVSFLREVLGLLDALPKSCRYLCDPVLGDHGRLYVPEELVDVYRTEVLPRAAVLTPNQFEAEQLTQLEINDVAGAVVACDKLHELGPPLVVLTTLDVADATSNKELIAMMLSESRGNKWLLTLSRIDGGPFTGTGDLTAAMLLAWMHRHPHEPAEALEKTGAVLNNVIRKTISMEAARMIGGRRVSPELRLISCKMDIESPRILSRCRLIRKQNERFQGVIFDLDGTLTLPGQINFQRIRERTGVPVGSNIVQYLREHYDGEDLAARLAIVDEEEQQGFNPPQLQDGVKSRLESLVAGGVRIGLFTRNTATCVKAFLQHAGLPEEFFAPVVTRDSAIANKPNPAPIAHCCQVWGLRAASVLVVGDHIDDMKSGKAAGAWTCAILPPPSADAYNSSGVAIGTAYAGVAANADFVISSLDALRRVFHE